MARSRMGVLLQAILLVLAAIGLYPFVYMIVNSLKSGVQTTDNPWWFTSWQLLWSNYSGALQATIQPYERSMFITAASVILILSFASLSAYAFARLNFYGKEILFIVIFALLLVPGFLTLIPLFIEIKGLHLLNNPWGLILPYIAGGQAFCIFILRSFFRAIPDDLFDAARIDGAGDVRIFRSMVLPLSVPVLVTLALLNIVGIWSDYLLPSLVMGNSNPTLAVAIVNFQPPAFAPVGNAFNIQLAAFTLASIPLALLFSFLMRYFVQGMTSGAIKM